MLLQTMQPTNKLMIRTVYIAVAALLVMLCGCSSNHTHQLSAKDKIWQAFTCWRSKGKNA